MSLHNAMVKQGHFLFRWRSYVPLLLAGPLLIALRESVVFEDIIFKPLDDLWAFFCFLLSLSGLLIRGMTVGFVPAGTSGRNTQGQRAEVLNTTGMYSIVRNPLYLGNFLILLGLILSIKIWWLVLLVSMFFFIYMERIIMAEESFLHDKYGPEYDSWRNKTPVIIPDFKNWLAPSLPFSMKTVLRREYPGLLGMVTAFLGMEMIVDLVFRKQSFQTWIVDDYMWTVIFLITLIFCLTLRHLKKNTDLLRVSGR